MVIRKAFLTCFIVFSILNLTAIRNSLGDHRLRVGVTQVNELRKLILIGISPYLNDLQQTFDFRPLGFEGEGMDRLDPKFLIELESKRIRVRSFELEDESGIPSILVDSHWAKASEIAHVSGNLAKATGRSLGFPTATATTLASIPSSYDENLKKLRAFYLLEIIRQSLPPLYRFNNLKDAVSEKTLRQIGEILLMRFHPSSNLAAIEVPDDPTGDFFERWNETQSGVRTDNKGYLIRRANQLGLPVISFEDTFALVCAGKPNPQYQSRLMGMGFPLDLLMSQTMASSDQLPENSCVPWFLVSMVNSMAPVEVINYFSPGNIAERIKKHTQTKLIERLAGSIIPLSNWPIHWIQSKIDKNQFRKENTQTLKRIQDFGAILALTESHAYDLPSDSLLVLDPLKLRLQSLLPVSSLNWFSSSDTFNQISTFLLSKEEQQSRIHSSPSPQDIQKGKTSVFRKLTEWIFKKKRKASRGPASVPTPAEERNPVILFFIDGLRPDRFKLAMKEGLLPQMKQYFYQKGVELESYASRSLTLPSWSTILTGFEPDSHGIRSNTPISRHLHQVTANHLSSTQVVSDFFHRMTNKAFKKLEEDRVGEDGKVWLPAYFPSGSTVVNYLPVSRRVKFVGVDLVEDIFQRLPEYVNSIRFHPSALDHASAEATVSAIEKDAAKDQRLRLVINWYSAVDEGTHYNNRLLPTIYRDLDQDFGKVVKAALAHPILKNATVFVVSDHGHSGGYGPFDDNHSWYNAGINYQKTSDGPLLINTGFQVAGFLAGDYEGYKDYRFTVGLADHAEPKFDKKLQLPTLKHIYPKNSSSPPNALVDGAGDSIAQVYIKGDEKWKRLNFNELSHFGGKLNIPSDLLNVRIKNLMTEDRRLRQRVLEYSDGHPVRLFAMALPGDTARQSADHFGDQPGLLSSTREPVLVLAHQKGSGQELRAALILTRRDSDGQDRFRYVVVKNFNQDRNGKIQGQISDQPDDDPLDYFGSVEGARISSQWRTDREWLLAARNHAMPTAIFALSRILTLSPTLTLPQRKDEIPDFILQAYPGYAFHTDAPMESDHGGLYREEVRNSFFVSSLLPGRYTPGGRIRGIPILTRDFFATFLNYAGLGDPGKAPLPPTQGMSFKETIESDWKQDSLPASWTSD